MVASGGESVISEYAGCIAAAYTGVSDGLSGAVVSGSYSSAGCVYKAGV